MMAVALDMRLIRAAATDAGNRYMRTHPEEAPDGTAAWSMGALHAATAEFHRLLRLAGLDVCAPLPKRGDGVS